MHFHRHSIFTIWAACSFVLFALPNAATAAEQLRATLTPATRELEISATELGDATYELEIETPGLQRVETGKDVGEPGIIYLPPREGEIKLTDTPAIPADAENVFFFNLVEMAEGWDLLARFSADAHGTWKLNGRFSPLGGPLAREVRIGVGMLEAGENLLHLRTPKAKPPALSYHRRVPAQKSFTSRLRVTRADWKGKVSLYRGSGDGRTKVASTDVTGRELTSAPRPVAAEWWRERDMVVNSVRALTENMLRAQITRPGAMFEGGFNLVYDVQHQAYRMPHWMWAWGPAVEMLYQMEDHPLARDAARAPAWRQVALEAARRTLAFPVTDPNHPGAGLTSVRWEPSRATPAGWAEYISTSDALFMAGWGWVSSYRETSDNVFIERTQSLVKAAERLMAQYPVVPQDWIVERGRWTPHTLDESVFGLVGFHELYRATNDARLPELARKYLESHLKHLGREKGLLERGWMRDMDEPIWDPDIKGHAWVVEGYLEAYRLVGDAKYLELARTLSDLVIESQHADGYWTYAFKQPGPGDLRDDKGTAIWAYFFYDMYRETKEPRYLAAARAAVGWCLRHQHFGDDPDLNGAVVNENSMAYVRRRPMTILYTNTFFGLALLQELSLPADARK